MIVFDEATSSLDGETETAALAALSGTLTLILIAHRLTSLAGADVVHLLDEGRLIALGPPDVVLPRIAAEPVPFDCVTPIRDGAAALRERMAYPA